MWKWKSSGRGGWRPVRRGGCCRFLGRIGTFFGACAVLAGCGGAQISPSHLSGDYGRGAWIPRSGGAGPSLYKPAFELPTDGFTISALLPELLAAYRLRLLDMGHAMPAGAAERYADAEIASLRRLYPGQDEALRAELIRRLRPIVARPGSPAELGDRLPLYPSDDEAARSEPKRRVP
jgi:hypothetical protein